MLLKLRSQLVHSCHISVQDALHDSLFYELNLFLRKFATQKVVIWNEQKFYGLSSMEVLLHVILAVHLEAIGACYNVVAVVVAVMLHIVAECRNDDTQIIQVGKMSVLTKSLLWQNQIDMLSYIWSM